MTISAQRSLRLRMLLVLVALPLTVVVFLGGIYALFGVALPWLFAELDGHFFQNEGLAMLFVALIVASFYYPVLGTIGGVRHTPLDRLDATRVDPDDREDLHAILDRLAARADLPRPRLLIAELSAPTAFTVGLRPSSARIVLTTELVETCTAEEIEAVLAHELAHVRHRDGAVMWAASVFPSVTYGIASVLYTKTLGADWLQSAHTARSRRPDDARYDPDRGSFVSTKGDGDGETRGADWLQSAHTARSRRPDDVDRGSHASSEDDGDETGGTAWWWYLPAFVTIAVALVSIVLTTIFAGVIWLASAIVLVVLSRTREFAADRYAAELVDDPAVVAEALETLDEGMARTPNRDLRTLDDGRNSLYILGVDGDWFDQPADGFPSDALLPSTHPPTEERVERLLATIDDH